MKRLMLAASLSAFLLAAGPAHADTLTLDEAIGLAAKASPRIQEADADLERSQASVSVARSAYLPEANLAAAATTGLGGSTTAALGVRGIMGSPFTRHYGAGVEGAWTIYDFGRTSSRVDAAAAGVGAARARKALSSRAAALEMVQAFGAVAMAEEDVRATSAVIALRTRGAEAARSLAAAGLRSEIDAMLATARAEEARAALASSQADVEAARVWLGALLGRPIAPTTTLSATPPAAGDVARAAAGAPLSPYDPLHAVAAAEAERAAAQGRLARAEHLPRLVVAGSAGYAYREAPDDPSYWAAGVGVVMPVLSFIPEGARAREAFATARAAAARAAQADIELKAQIGREVASLRALSASTSAADASVAAAKTAFDAAEARYGAGQLSFAEADAARDTFVRIESTRRRLGLQGALALARLWILTERPTDRRAAAP
jgi:outer membrane protein TolC